MFWHWKLPQRLLCSLKVIKISFGLEYQFCKYNILPYTVWTELNKSWKLPNFWGIFGGLFLNDMFEFLLVALYQFTSQASNIFRYAVKEEDNFFQCKGCTWSTAVLRYMSK